jgi:phospholipid/cholesterol/gamma-HCH transport system permease protein
MASVPANPAAAPFAAPPRDRGRIERDAREGGARVLALGGRLTVANIAPLDRALRALDPTPAPLVIDVSAVRRVDTTGAWVLHRTLRDWRARGQAATLVGASEDVRALVARVAEADRPCRVHSHRDDSPAERLAAIGRDVLRFIGQLGGFLAFLGTTLVALARVIPQPRRWRVNAVVHQAEAVMVNAVPIVGLMLFLVGFVIAQQGAVQLRQFGAEVFTINLVGRATLRELGVLMTAIMVAGRSGSAFAAQIGSMKLAEEVDALRTIGVSPFEALVAPRVIALVLTMPLLAFFACVCALIGGGLYCWIDLQIPPATFVRRLQEIVPITDFWITMIKAPLFGAIIAIVGCHEGMQVRGDAESVGAHTTTAVVQAIFSVIVLDAFLAVFFTALGWV